MKELFDNLDAALFDLDGTLVETNIDFPLMRTEMLRMAGEKGFAKADLGARDILAIVDTVEEQLRCDSRDSEADAFRCEAFKVLEEIELRHSASTKEIYYARELLDELNGRNIKVGIVTRNCRKASEMSLMMTGLQPEVLLSRDDVRKTKPHPDQLFEALRILGSVPEKSMMVGDHPMDILAGKSAEMRTVGVLLPDRPTDFFDQAKPDAVIKSLKELVDALIDCYS